MSRLLGDQISAVGHVWLLHLAAHWHHLGVHARRGRRVRVSAHVRRVPFTRGTSSVHAFWATGVLAEPRQLKDGLGPRVRAAHRLSAGGQGDEDPQEYDDCVVKVNVV